MSRISLKLDGVLFDCLFMGEDMYVCMYDFCVDCYWGGYLFERKKLRIRSAHSRARMPVVIVALGWNGVWGLGL